MADLDPRVGWIDPGNSQEPKEQRLQELQGSATGGTTFRTEFLSGPERTCPHVDDLQEMVLTW